MARQAKKRKRDVLVKAIGKLLVAFKKVTIHFTLFTFLSFA